MNRLIPVLLMTLIGVAPLKPAAAQTNGYTVTDLGLIPNATGSQAKAINDSGWVVGQATIIIKGATKPYKAWLWTPSAPNAPSGSPRTLEPLAGRDRSEALDVNNAGLIVGNSGSSTSGTTSLATFWQAPDFAPADFNSLPRDLASDPALADWSFLDARSVTDPVDGTGEIYVAGYGTNGAFSGGIVWRMDAAGTIVGVVKVEGYYGDYYSGRMNNRAQVADWVVAENGSSQATLGDGITGTGHYLGTLGGTDAWGNDINDYGTMVGFSRNLAEQGRGFVWTPAVPNGTQGKMVELFTLGGSSSVANGINNLNQIVGDSYLKGDRTRHACLWQNGATTPTDLNSLKTAGATQLELLNAYQINNKGGIIGRFYSKSYRAFLLTPRP